jgi:endo-1,4-beta-xylanase
MTAPFPLGVAAMSGQIADPGWRLLADAHFNQLTPEWELKMEYVVQDDGGYRFDAPDRLAAYARESGKRFFGHALIWYAQTPKAFERLAATPPAFEAAYRNYILEVVGRYRGQAVGWDVVNEPVLDDGSGYRDCLWRQRFGMAYVDRAFHVAAEADPAATLFINEYGLERPAKRTPYLRLIEGLLQRGVPLGGIGTQSHLDVETAPTAYRDALRDLAGFGLPVHVSELDISFGRGAAAALRGDRENALRQARVVDAVAQAFLDLPEAQRFGLTVWGVRDGDSWLRRPPNDGGAPRDAPLLFDDSGRPKPAFEALARAFA